MVAKTVHELESTEIAELIEQCAQGYDEAKARFVTHYADLIRAAVRRKLASLPDYGSLADDYEDICQEIFLRLFADRCKALQRINEPGSIRAWLVTVSQNQVITFLRRRATRVNTVASASFEAKVIYSPKPPDSTVHKTELLRLEEHIRSLSTEERLIIQLYFEENLRYSEIAEVMNLNINTVSSKLRRAKHKLRQLLAEKSDE